jgi:hypothetical protein
MCGRDARVMRLSGMHGAQRSQATGQKEDKVVRRGRSGRRKEEKRKNATRCGSAREMK